LPLSTNSYRYWSAGHVLEQIDLLVNRHGVRNIKIADEMFVLNRKHVLAICRGIIQRNYGLNLWAYARVDTIKDDMLVSLREAGFSWLALGIEAGAENVRATVDKRFHQEEVFEVVHKIRAAGINVIGNFIFGLPDDDADTMQATLDLAQELNCEFANFYSTMAYPGSALYAQAVQHGVPLPRTWAGYGQHARDCVPLPTHSLTARDVLQFRDDAFLQYYTNPDYLKMIENRFGTATVQHLQQMTAFRLDRDLLNGTLDVPLVTLPHARPATLRAILAAG
jgi:anaerobic magnesium-protoporphyrin IX monomethyl ester cyclase